MGKVPYIIPFKTRVKAFRKLIKLDKQSTQGPATPETSGKGISRLQFLFEVEMQDDGTPRPHV